MRKHFSVFMLAARGTLFKFLGIYAGMAALEFALVFWRLQQLPRNIAPGVTYQQWVADNYSSGIYQMEAFFRKSFVAFIFLAAVVALCFLLSNNLKDKSSYASFTLRRLSISHQMVVLWCSLYYAILFFFLWALQSALLLCFCHMFLAQIDPIFVNEQTVFLATLRSPFLGYIIPQGNKLVFAANIIFCLGLGLLCSFSTLRRKRSAGQVYILSFIAARMFITSNFYSMQYDNTSHFVFASVMLLMLIALLLVLVLKINDYMEETYLLQETPKTSSWGLQQGYHFAAMGAYYNGYYDNAVQDEDGDELDAQEEVPQ